MGRKHTQGLEIKGPTLLSFPALDTNGVIYQGRKCEAEKPLSPQCSLIFQGRVELISL